MPRRARFRDVTIVLVPLNAIRQDSAYSKVSVYLSLCTYSCAEMVSFFHCVCSKDYTTTFLHPLNYLPHLHTKRERESYKQRLR